MVNKDYLLMMFMQYSKSCAVKMLFVQLKAVPTGVLISEIPTLALNQDNIDSNKTVIRV